MPSSGRKEGKGKVPRDYVRRGSRGLPCVEGFAVGGPGKNVLFFRGRFRMRAADGFSWFLPEFFRIPGCLVSTWSATDPSPGTTFSTPSGSPASEQSFVASKIPQDVSSAGFSCCFSRESLLEKRSGGKPVAGGRGRAVDSE